MILMSTSHWRHLGTVSQSTMGPRLVLRMPTSEDQNFIKIDPIDTKFFLYILQNFSSIWIKYEIRPNSITISEKRQFFPVIWQCRFSDTTISTSDVLCCWLESISCNRLFFFISLWFHIIYHLIFWNNFVVVTFSVTLWCSFGSAH